MKQQMKQTTKRCFAVLLAMLMLFSCFSVAVSAADWSGEVYIVNYPRAADPNKSGWGHPDLYLMDGWYMKASDKMVMRSIDGYEGPTCYCIEPGISQHTGDTLYQKGEDYWDYYPGNPTISADGINNLIGTILQYGWTGNNSLNWITTDPTAANELAQAKATQILIHEVVVGERRDDFSKINAHDYGCNNAAEQVTADCPIYAQIMEHYYRIEAAVQQHLLQPNFGGTEFELGYNNGTYSVTLTDRNNVLGKYNFSSNADVSIQKNGNQLTISTTNPTSESIQVNASAQYQLGKLYFNGEELPQDVNRGIWYMEQAISNGNDSAMCFLGRAYLVGDNVPKSIKKGLELLQAAADRGNEYAAKMIENFNANAAHTAISILHKLSLMLQNNTAVMAAKKPVMPAVDKKELLAILRKKEEQGIRFD